MCDDLGLSNFGMFFNPKKELKMKDRADLLEAFIGALYVDKDLEFCAAFAKVCFFPRLFHFIYHQSWNDPKSKLQQCCLTLRGMDKEEPDIPIYKVTKRAKSKLFRINQFWVSICFLRSNRFFTFPDNS